MGMLREACDTAEDQVAVFKRSGKPEQIFLAMGDLGLVIDQVLDGVRNVWHLTEAADAGGKSRIGRRDYELKRVRLWEEWKLESHEPSLLVPGPVIERSHPSRLCVYWRGKRIGFLVPIFSSPDQPPGFDVWDPFKVSYKRPFYGRLDDALDRLMEEISAVHQFEPACDADGETGIV